MEKYNCKECGKLLFEGSFVGEVKKKCPKCKVMNTFNVEKFVRHEKFCNVNKLS